MKHKPLLLLLVLILMLLQTCGYAEIIESFSIKKEKGEMIFVENGKNVGRVMDNAKPNVKKALYKGKTFFMKDVNVYNGVLELRNKIEGIIASRVLNNIFKDKEKRYPLLSLAFNPEVYIDYSVEPFHILSEDLKGFTSIAAMQPYKKTEIEVSDLENLYIGMYLIGGGDPHMHNIFYNPTNQYLGSVDLDVSFKEHTRYRIQLQRNERTSPDFFKQYSDLAIRTINCSDILANFLFMTDSRFEQKIPWGGYYDRNMPLYREALEMDKKRLGKSIDILCDAFPDKESLCLFITHTVKTIKEDFKKIINEKIRLDPCEEGSIFNVTGEYFNKDSDTYKKYKEDSLIKSVEYLFDEDEHYIEKICQFVENRYLTLICIFNNPNNIVKEICEQCLIDPEVNEQQADLYTYRNDEECALEEEL